MQALVLDKVVTTVQKNKTGIFISSVLAIVLVLLLIVTAVLYFADNKYYAIPGVLAIFTLLGFTFSSVFTYFKARQDALGACESCTTGSKESTYVGEGEDEDNVIEYEPTEQEEANLVDCLALIKELAEKVDKNDKLTETIEKMNNAIVLESSTITVEMLVNYLEEVCKAMEDQAYDEAEKKEMVDVLQELSKVAQKDKEILDKISEIAERLKIELK